MHMVDRCFTLYSTDNLVLFKTSNYSLVSCYVYCSVEERMLFVGREGTLKTDWSIANEAWCSEYRWSKWLVNGAAEV